MLVRSRKQLADVVARDPLGKIAKDPSRYLVTFLRSKPPAKLVRALAAEDVAPERFAIQGREVYAWHPAAFHVEAEQAAAQRLDVTARHATGTPSRSCSSSPASTGPRGEPRPRVGLGDREW